MEKTNRIESNDRDKGIYSSNNVFSLTLSIEQAVGPSETVEEKGRKKNNKEKGLVGHYLML